MLEEVGISLTKGQQGPKVVCRRTRRSQVIRVSMGDDPSKGHPRKADAARTT